VLESGKFPGVKVPDPALDDIAGTGGLFAGDDRGALEDGTKGQARPHAAGEVAYGAEGSLLLQLAEGVALIVEGGEVARRVLIGVRRGGGPAEKGVRVEVAEEHLGNLRADGGHGRGGSGVIGSNVNGGADQECQRYQVRLGNVLGAGQGGPLHGESMGQGGLGYGEADDLLGRGVSQGTGIEVNLEAT
jgi:hypothetical protein